MILGCDATEVDDPDFTATRRASVDQIIDYFKAAWKYLPLDGDEFPMESVIGIFGGCRPHADTNDFVIGEVRMHRDSSMPAAQNRRDSHLQ